MQQTLFGDDFSEKKEKGLKIVAKGQKPLSKNQQLFNKLTKRIENLEKETVKEEEKLTRLLKMHSKEIIPLQEKVANARIKLAMTLEKAAEVNKFSKKQSENIRETILTLCDDAFTDMEPSPEQEAFYDKWADVPYQEEIEQVKTETKEMFSDFMSEMFGLDIDLTDFDESQEGFARFQEKIKEQFEQTQTQQRQKQRKKGKKRQAIEEEKQAEAEIKNKSIRSVYIALAKVLHPDTEPDPGLKAEKEEILKRVTVAYEQKDLITLLKLEMEWVHQTSEHLEKLTEDKLKVYVSALKQQATELEREKRNLAYHPQYEAVSPYGHYPENYAFTKIRSEITELKSIFDNLLHFIRAFENPNAKKEITAFVNDVSKQNKQTNFPDYL